MEAASARGLERRRQELLAPPCLDTESLRKSRPPAREPGALRCLTPNGRCVGQDSSTAHPSQCLTSPGDCGVPIPSFPVFPLLVTGTHDVLAPIYRKGQVISILPTLLWLCDPKRCQ